MSHDRVTVVCATFNARDAVRLTFSSFARYNPGRWRIFIADNGSTDGTLQDLHARPEVTVVSLTQRQNLHQRELTSHREVLQSLGQDPLLLSRLPLGSSPAESAEALSEHGVTLDWLLGRVSTEYILIMDSDVEFTQPNCVQDMVAVADQQRLAALGVYEAGYRGYQPRLAPYLLLMRTEIARSLHTSFRGVWVCDDPREADRWALESQRWEVSRAELARFKSTRIYPTGALLFERLDAEGHRWADLLPGLADRFHHYGHLSWGNLADDEGGSTASRGEHESNLTLVRQALAAYD